MNNEEIKPENINPEENIETNTSENEVVVDVAPETPENDETVTDNAKAGNSVEVEREKFLRLYAEFENYKRRTSKEKLEMLLTASKDIIVQLLPVIDDMERAFKMLDGQSEEVKKELEGFKLIHKKFYSILEAKGLKPIEAVGQKFDVELHEAITKIPAPTDDMKGKVVDEVEKGYTLNDSVVRYSKVVIGE